MFIGELSQRTGASRKALYLYESMGLIPAPMRQGTYRVYGPEVVGLVHIIRCAQSLGFKLSELAEAVPQASSAQALPGPQVIAQHLQRKRLALQQQISQAQDTLARLDEMEQQLQELPLSWQSCEKNT
jgi:DNA-binding transcriptional MerR regulator